MSYTKGALEEAQLGRQALDSYVVAVTDSLAVTVNSSILQEGIYTLCANVDIWFRQGNSSVAAAIETDGSRFLIAGGEFDLFVDGNSSAYVSAIAAGSPGYVVLGPNRGTL